MRNRKKLGEILVDLDVLTPADVDRVLDAQERSVDRHRKFGYLARDMGLLEEEHILAALAIQMELLPGIENLGLDEVLESLLAADGISG